MPYILISTQIRLECGPTVCGDEHADPEIMEYLGAKLVTHLGNNFPEYTCPDVPRIILNKLEKIGYRVAGMTGIGQTCIWTMYKPDKSMERFEKEKPPMPQT
ncbi:GTP cyclohydrolase 1 feedback regulatory protein-like isoform X1 [Ptychodera flava]|uniref:GTP cyclohydrolase 1 feedback regulatory protein-like isoform X1 n=1 Tax=Ptychodera flava TaxID=63121 RepID=UPI00396AABD4